MAERVPQVSVVIPCFNEGQTIPRLVGALDRASSQLESTGRSTEVIVVDDGSRDETWSRLADAARSRPWLRLVRFRRNFGQTAAMSAGFKLARGTYIVPMDADLQNDPDDIPALVSKLEEGFDVVSGWRKNRQDKALSRKIPSRVANWVIGSVSGLRLHDYGCTLKGYRREVLEPVRLYGEMHRFIPIYAKWAGARVTEMVVRHHPRKEGKSKYGLGRTLKVILDLLTVKFLGDYSTKPLYLFGLWGLLLCLAGTACGIITLVQKFVDGAYAHRNPLLLLAVLLFIVGMQLIGMGLLAELQVRTYHESQAKPIYLVAEEVNAPCAELPASSPPVTAKG
ncbi:MAG: glycosyltransferase family 2 protein [Deltaproteobacteria bacterium]|nr:glycosyltransferase family 2 protein [Deltaproteobacteria bacterium]